MSTAGLYRPPQWSNGPAMVSITQVPVQGQGNSGFTTVDGVPTLGGSASTQTTYVFDAVLDLEHEQRLEKTHHPVQTGADISSHAYLMPARLVMNIGMSDAMDAYSTGQNDTNSAGNANPNTVAPFTGTSSSKSVNAYQTMITLQAARQPLTVTTRLRTYTNMMVVGVSPHEDYKTITGLRMRVEFEQIFMASTMSGGTTASQPALNARPDTAPPAGLGQVNPGSVSSTTQQQFQYPQQGTGTGNGQPYISSTGEAFYYPPTTSVPGAGAYSSTPGQQALP